MKVILGTRQSGKTHDLIRISERTRAKIVTFDRRAIRHILDIAREIGADIPIPIAYKDLREPHNREGIRSIIIDDLDALLRSMFAINIEAVSISIEEDRI